MPDPISFYTGTSEEFNNANKDNDGIYFISDTQQIYKGEVLYGLGVGIATPDSVGIIKPGSDFDISADGTLTLYETIAISSFSNNVNNVEMGRTIQNVTLNWSTNKVPTTLSLKQGSRVLTTANTANTHTLSGQTITSNTTYTLEVADARKASASRTTSITFLNGRYYGVSAVNDSDNISNSFIQGLTKTLASSRTCSFTVNAGTGQYIYFAIPTRFGTPSFYVGGFEGGFGNVKTFNYTNPSGYSELYNVYRSTNASLGSTTVEVR